MGAAATDGELIARRAYSRQRRFDLGRIEHYRVLCAVNLFDQRLGSSVQSRQRLETQTGRRHAIDALEKSSLFKHVRRVEIDQLVMTHSSNAERRSVLDQRHRMESDAITKPYLRTSERARQRASQI